MIKKVYFILVAGVITCAVIAGKKKTTDSFENDLIMANVEALSQTESSYDCVLTKDECKFEVKTQWQIDILKNRLGIDGASIGATLDLSSGTQIYRTKSWWERGVRCGTDVTCNAFLKELGL